MDLGKLRAWWWHRQGLDGSLMGKSPAAVLSRAGWARSVGGVNPYLTLFARAGSSRGLADAAAEAMQIYEQPSARGCTYVLPAADFALGLRVGQGFGDAATLSTAKKFLDVTDAEVDRLCVAVLDALSGGEKDPAELRSQLGGVVRNLGEAGKKRGLTTTLSIALGRLQSAGEIRRVPVDGRLDQQRYRYARWRDSGRGKGNAASMPLEEAYTEVARRFFGWIAPATLAHFRWFSGLGVAAAKAAVAPLGLVDIGEGWLMGAEDREECAAFHAPEEPIIALISGLDSLLLLRRDLISLVDVPEDGGRRPDRVVGAALGSPDLKNHGIFDRGRLIGLWEYDPASQSIVWASKEPSEELRAAVLRTEAFVRDELGDARSFSLDSAKSRQPRIEALRAMA